MAELSPNLVVLMPVYEDREACSLLLRRLDAHIHVPYSVVIVDDGSRSHPFKFERGVHPHMDGHLLRLHDNFGHQMAISVGLRFIAECVRHDQLVVIMDSDGEDLPQAIQRLAAGLEAASDVAVASRGNRNEGRLFQLLYVVYKLLFRCLTGKRMNFGNFMLLRGSAVKRLCTMPTLARHVAATVLVSELEVQRIRVDRGHRYAGRSKMNLLRLVQHGIASFSVFATVARRRLAMATAVFGGLALACGLAFGTGVFGWDQENAALRIATATTVFISLCAAAASSNFASRLAKHHEPLKPLVQLEKLFTISAETIGDTPLAPTQPEHGFAQSKIDPGSIPQGTQPPFPQHLPV
jgi:polyisoprenyl-phosphate glycosyltransferase